MSAVKQIVKAGAKATKELAKDATAKLAKDFSPATERSGVDFLLTLGREAKEFVDDKFARSDIQKISGDDIPRFGRLARQAALKEVNPKIIELRIMPEMNSIIQNARREADDIFRQRQINEIKTGNKKYQQFNYETPVDPRLEPIRKTKEGKLQNTYSQESKDYLTDDVIRSQTTMSPEEFAKVGYPSSAREAVRKKVRLYKDPYSGVIMTWKFKKITKGKNKGLYTLSPQPLKKKQEGRKLTSGKKRDLQEDQQTLGKRDTSIIPKADEHIHHRNQLGRIAKLIEEGDPSQQRAWLKFIAKKIGYPTGAGDGNLIAIKKAIHKAYHAAEKGIPIPAVKGGSKPAETLAVLREYLSTQRNLDEILENLMRTNK